MPDERKKQPPPFIQITGGGKIGDMTVSGNKAVGYGSILNNDGVSVDNLNVSDNIHVGVQDPTSIGGDGSSATVNDPWYKRPLGIIALSVTAGLVLAAAVWAFKYYFG